MKHLNIDLLNKISEILQLKNFNEYVNKYKNPITDFIDNKTVSVFIDEDKNYLLLSTGDIYSFFYGKFLKISSCKTNKGNFKYYYYKLKINKESKTFFISRLLYFYFKKHNFNTIEELPEVRYKDKNTFNFNLDNLYLNNNNELMKEIVSYRKPNYNSKLKQKDLKKIKIFLSLKMTYKEIGEIYHISDMAVYRFCQRNKLYSITTLKNMFLKKTINLKEYKEKLLTFKNN